MGSSTLVKRAHSHSSLAEHEQRMRMVEIRDRIHEAQILELCVAMARTGRDLYIDPKTMEITGEDLLDQKVRQSYISLLVNKLISNAVAPKEIAPENNLDKWADVIAAETDESSEDSP